MNATAAIDRMRSLEKDWDTYGSDPPSEVAIANAKAFVARLESVGLAPKHIDPSSDEAVSVTFQYSPGRGVWVEFYNDGDISHIFLDDVITKPGEPCLKWDGGAGKLLAEMSE